MSVDSTVYMEPIVFINDASFLSGTNDDLSGFELIVDYHKALELLFEQDLESPYVVWNDFFSNLVSDLLLHKDYKESQTEILSNSKKLKGDALKNNIRKRKAFLLRKKNGLIENAAYDEFVKKVSDEVIYMLNMVATYRYFYGYQPETKLEVIFDILKKGCLPCGAKKEQNEISIFNPILLKEGG